MISLNLCIKASKPTATSFIAVKGCKRITTTKQIYQKQDIYCRTSLLKHQRTVEWGAINP